MSSIFEDVEDIEMVDVEEGELIEHTSPRKTGQINGEELGAINEESCNKNRRRRNNKKKNKRKRGSSGPKITDINRFVLDVCKRLKEKKSYLVWTAVGCLGVSALSDLVKEVDAIQACGGQKTADGKRFRTGGGILWNILKVRDPNAYKEIMKKGNEFEKQFKQKNMRQAPAQNKGDSSQGNNLPSTDETTAVGSILDAKPANMQNQPEQCNVEQKRSSVHDRVRVPVAYDDDLLATEDPTDETVAV